MCYVLPLEDVDPTANLTIRGSDQRLPSRLVISVLTCLMNIIPLITPVLIITYKLSRIHNSRLLQNI